MLPGPEVEIEAKAVFGSVEMIVPEGVHVELSGGGALSSQELKVEGRAARRRAADPDPPPRRLRVARRSAAGRGLIDQLKESARRLAERLEQPRE